MNSLRLVQYYLPGSVGTNARCTASISKRSTFRFGVVTHLTFWTCTRNRIWVKWIGYSWKKWNKVLKLTLNTCTSNVWWNTITQICKIQLSVSFTSLIIWIALISNLHANIWLIVCKISVANYYRQWLEATCFRTGLPTPRGRQPWWVTLEDHISALFVPQDSIPTKIRSENGQGSLLKASDLYFSAHYFVKLTFLSGLLTFSV